VVLRVTNAYLIYRYRSSLPKHLYSSRANLAHNTLVFPRLLFEVIAFWGGRILAVTLLNVL
jgi:hypothetical protein